MKESPGISRRALLLLLAASGAASAFPVGATAQALPSVGLGSWITFNVGDDPVLRAECAAVIGAFFQAGGRMIDSSPMYGSSQEVIGWSLARLGMPDAPFSADKVWTSDDGPAQIEESRRRWGVRRSPTPPCVGGSPPRSGRSECPNGGATRRRTS
ncbi:MAG: aldo/keto reductase [Alphaproteobacteria bacterium]|nr:aldo/keto reductase [Alphaproteobacteria bacterium]